MRKLLPVSPFFSSLLRFIFPVLFSAGSGTRPRTPSLSLSADLATCGPFCFAEGRIFIFFHGRVRSYHAVRSLIRAPSPLGGVYSKADLM